MTDEFTYLYGEEKYNISIRLENIPEPRNMSEWT